MISLKCGKCGMVHNLTEDHVVGRGYGFYCPNCGEPLPSSLENAILQSVFQSLMDGRHIFFPLQKNFANYSFRLSAIAQSLLFTQSNTL